MAYLAHAQAAESRLAKVVEALRPFAEAATAMEISGQPAAYHVGAASCETARAVLTEIEGKSQ